MSDKNKLDFAAKLVKNALALSIIRKNLGDKEDLSDDTMAVSLENGVYHVTYRNVHKFSYTQEEIQQAVDKLVLDMDQAD